MKLYLFGKTSQCNICWDYKTKNNLRKSICKSCKKHLNK